MATTFPARAERVPGHVVVVGATTTPTLVGLTDAEAIERRRRGQGNDLSLPTSRSSWRIVRDNALNSINLICFGVGAGLVGLGLFGDALVTVGLVALNIAIATVLDIRSKRALDRIALLARPTATVLRAGAERSVDPDEIVLGDLLVAAVGDQIVVDGRIVSEETAEVDESLLTGESEPVAKRVGDPVLSGSFCMAGRVVYEAEAVGVGSLANGLTARARAFRQIKTPVQREVGLVLRVMAVLILVLGGPVVLDLGIRVAATAVALVSPSAGETLDHAYRDFSVEESVRSAAVIVGLVPQGLALMLVVTYAMGALRLAGRRVLLHQANAVESLSHVDVLCLDKTGTLTTNRLIYAACHPIGTTTERLEAIVADVAASVSSPNRTVEALVAALPGQRLDVVDEVAFSSARKWSSLTFAGGGRAGRYVLGAPEVILPAIRSGISLPPILDEWTAAGLRVLLLAHRAGTAARTGGSDEPTLPDDLLPLGLIAFQDQLQPFAAQTMAGFAEAGIQLKIISGDHPRTVAALAQQAGVDVGGATASISGMDLAGMDEDGMRRAASEGVIFGRVTPDQKLALIRHLQEAGHYVSMIGDGVNDVLALKQAQVGIAMAGGSQATRIVSDLVLLDDSFEALPHAFEEGQRIVRGTQDLIKLFVARSLSLTIAILGVAVIGGAFPVTPKHNAVPALLVIGIPTLALAAWATPGRVPRDLLRSVLPFALPAALTIGAVEGTLYISYLRATGDVRLAQTVMTVVATLCGLALLLVARRPADARDGDVRVDRERRVVILAAGMLALLVAAVAVPEVRSYVEFAPLDVVDVAIVAIVTGVWAIVLWYMWRWKLLERFLRLDTPAPTVPPSG